MRKSDWMKVKGQNPYRKESLWFTIYSSFRLICPVNGPSPRVCIYLCVSSKIFFENSYLFYFSIISSFPFETYINVKKMTIPIYNKEL